MCEILFCLNSLTSQYLRLTHLGKIKKNLPLSYIQPAGKASYQGELTLRSSRLLIQPAMFDLKMEAAEGDGAGKDKNIHSPTPLLIFDHRSPNSLPSLPLPLKSKMAAIIFTKKILNTRCPKLRQLCRLSYMGRPTLSYQERVDCIKITSKNRLHVSLWKLNQLGSEIIEKRTLIMCTYHCLSISEAGSVWKRSINM